MGDHERAREALTIVEAAEELGVSPSTIRRGIRRGEIAAVPIGRRIVRISRAEVRRLLEPTKVQA